MDELPATNARRQTRALHWTPSLSHLWALVCLAAIFILLNLSRVQPNDFWWHVRTGQWIVDHGRIPTVDLFSYTRAGQPYSYGLWWLMQVALWLTMRAGGLPLVLFLHAVVITVAYGLLLWTSRRVAGCDLRWAALATLAAAAVGFANWNVRPQTISLLFFALTLALIKRHEAMHHTGSAGRWSDRWLWALPPLLAVWANCHGAYLFGLGLLGMSLLVDLLRWLRRKAPFPGQLVLVTALCLAATLLTPLGLGTDRAALGLSGNQVVRDLTLEWMPPTIRTPDGKLFFGFAVIWLAVLLGSGRRPGAHEAMRLALFCVLALMARRNEIWFGFVAAPTLAAGLHTWTARSPARAGRPGRPMLNWAVIFLVGLLIVLSLPWLRPRLPLPPAQRAYLTSDTPVEAVAFLQTLPQPLRTFHTETCGSYMIWASPEVPVFVDTRIELYPLKQWEDYLALNMARYDWETILDRYDVDTLLLDQKAQRPLIRAAAASPNWECVYEDDQSAIFVRRGRS